MFSTLSELCNKTKEGFKQQDLSMFNFLQLPNRDECLIFIQRSSLSSKSNFFIGMP